MAKTPIIEKFQTAYDDAMGVNPGGAGLAVAECTKKLKRLTNTAKARTVKQLFEDRAVPQTFGPLVRYRCEKTLASFSGEKPDKDKWTEGSLDLTEGGAYIAIKEVCSADDDGMGIVSARVVEPGGDELERRRAVMDHFNWSHGARGMARELDWVLDIEID